MTTLVENLNENRYQAKNIMKEAGNYVIEILEKRLPQSRRAMGKVLDGKLYSAIVSANTEMGADALKMVAERLMEKLSADKAFAFVPLSLNHVGVENEMLSNTGLLRVTHYFDVTNSRQVVSFEVAAGRAPEVEVEVKVTPL